jgi:hypothetical protein
LVFSFVAALRLLPNRGEKQAINSKAKETRQRKLMIASKIERRSGILAGA